jgi:hypothetical protein
MTVSTGIIVSSIAPAYENSEHKVEVVHPVRDSHVSRRAQPGSLGGFIRL